MTLEYRLFDSDGRLRRQSDEQPSDLTSLQRPHRRIDGDGIYGDDKAMMTRWFEQRLCA